MREYLEKFLPLILALAIFFCAFLPVQAAEESVYPYYYEFYSADLSGNEYITWAYSDVPCVYVKDIYNDGMLYLVLLEAGYCNYGDSSGRRCGTYYAGGVSPIITHSPGLGEAFRLYPAFIKGQQVCVSEFLEPTDDDTFIFDSLDSVIAYAESGDLSGLLHGVVGDVPGSGGTITDDILDGIWGGIVDQEVVLEEDDGTVIGSIRTWIKNLANMISSPLQTVKELIKKIPLSTVTILEGSKFFDKILQLVNDVNSMKFDLLENFAESEPGKKLFEIVDTINGLPLELINKFAESEFGKTVFSIVDYINGLPLELINKFAESDFGSWLLNINEKINSIPRDILNFFLESDFGDLLDLVNTVNSFKWELPKSIMEYLGDELELLFVPDKANLEARVTSIREEFAFIDSLFEAGKHVLNTLQASTGTKAPVITVDLSKYAGSHYWGNQTVTIDFSWYAPYKQSVDVVIASIIWVTWLWSVWKRLPEIISGAGMVTDVQSMSADIGRGSRPKPARDFIIIPRGKGK